MAKTKTLGPIKSVSAPSPTRRVDQKADDKTLTIYANNATVELSNWDVKIRLGLIDSATPEVVTVRDVIHLYMSHEHAKAFSDALAVMLQQFDKIRHKVDAAAAAKTH